MTAWATIRRITITSALVLSAFVFASLTAISQDSRPNFIGPLKPAKPTAPQLREIAEKAERAGDWEAAFNAYCHLFVVDRATPELREKLNTSLRYVQQLRRHRDPGYQQFASSMPLDGGLDLFAEVIQKIPTAYADRDKATAQHLWGYAIQELDRALGNGTFRTVFLENAKPEKVEQFRAVLRDTWAKRTIADQSHARANMRRLIASAQDHFALRVPAAFAVEAACGACSGLDEYTVFLTPNAGTEVSPIHDLSTAGLFLGVVKGQLVVEAILPNSWIAHAYPQLRPGDRLTALNNKAMDTGGIPNAVTALRKPVEGAHLLDIRGNDDAKLQLRVPLVIPSVYGTRMIPDKPVGYTRVGNFQPATPRELDVAIASLKDAGARAIVLDLRGNHGGSFLAAVETARRLLPNGVIVTTQGQLTEVASQTFNSTSGGSAHDIPVVLLIDAETASAAEVLVAALKDNNRATVVGMPSFGKGTLQYPMRLVTLDDIDPATGKKVSKTGTVRVTIAKLIAPTSGPLNGNGLSPHFLEADPILQLELAATKAEERATTPLMPAMPAMATMPALPSPQLPMIP